MPQREPLTPAIESLHADHSLSTETRVAIQTMRTRVSDLLANRASGLLVVIGPCAMTHDRNILQQENAAIRTLDDSNEPIVALHRMPPWKPRTNPNDWFGLGTTDPEAAFNMLHNSAESSANVTIELGHTGHLPRYGDRLSMGWIGARNDSNSSLIDAVATYDTGMPIAVKNSLDGSVDTAMEHIRRIRQLRKKDVAAGEAALLFRGGSQIDSPDLWEDQLLRVMEQADQQDVSVIVDVAHGSEMAHDPNGLFEKSIVGQVACLEHLGMIAVRDGITPHGVMIEASSAKSPTDPVMPFMQALDLAKGLAHIRQTKMVLDSN